MLCLVKKAFSVLIVHKTMVCNLTHNSTDLMNHSEEFKR
jgi:hypothetical protein